MRKRTSFSSALNGGSANKEYDIPHIRELALGAIRQSVLIADGSQDDYPIVFANTAFLDLTGYSLDEVLGKNCRFMCGSETSKETRKQMRIA